jgi:hypothetical protein
LSCHGASGHGATASLAAGSWDSGALTRIPYEDLCIFSVKEFWRNQNLTEYLSTSFRDDSSEHIIVFVDLIRYDIIDNKYYLSFANATMLILVRFSS